ncbi:MAG TPA: tetratricopeptide repeat protein [Armatimonadota bacterium]|jgi:tetratricopeptide (TPR) repeat protein
MSATTHFFYLNPSSPARARLLEVENYFLAGNLNEALAAAQQAWREHPAEPDVFRVLAYIHMARGEYSPAAQAAYQAVKIDSENPASYAILAQVYVTFNMLQLATETLNVALQRYPEDASLLVLAADTKFRRGQVGEAADMAERALQHNPHDAYAQALLGTHRLQKKRYYDAELLLSGAVAAYPQRWDYLRDYGIALLHHGKPAEAREALTRSFQINQADPLTQRNLYLALRLVDADASWYPKLVVFFFQHSGLGAALLILGAISFCIGVGWLVVLWRVLQSDLFSLVWAFLLCLGGIALLIFTQEGTLLSGRQGKRLINYLERRLPPA